MTSTVDNLFIKLNKQTKFMMQTFLVLVERRFKVPLDETNSKRIAVLTLGGGELVFRYYGSLTRKLNLQPISFRLASDR